MAKSIDYVLFDWDGCLARTMHLLLRALKTELGKQDLRLTDKQVIRYMFGNWLGGLRYWGVADAEETVVKIKEE